MGGAAAETFDIVIAGAGPAGSAAAIRLAREGLGVLLVERARFPREKLCGEFVSPECARHFADLDVPLLGAEHHPQIGSTVFYSESGRSVEFRSDWFGTGHPALGISRAEMDQRLLERARDCGATVLTETAVTETAVDGDLGVRLRLRESNGLARSVEAGIAIDATGRKRVLASRLSASSKASKVAFKTHLTAATVPRSRCEIYSYLGGYGGCNAVGADRYNLCFIADAGLVKSVGSDGEKIMRSVVFRNTAARRALESAVFDEDWLAVPVSGFGRRPPVERGRLFFIGDSAAFIDPFTGSGILLALQSAEVCAEAIVAGFRSNSSPDAIASAYQKGYDALLANRLRVSSILRPASSSPRLAEVLLAVASKSERLRAALARATRFSGVPGV